MSFKEFGSIRKVLDDVLFHWNKTDRDQNAGELRLSGNYGRADFLNDAVRWDHANAAVEEASKKREAAAAQLALDKAALKDRLQAFSFTVKGLLAGTEYATMLPRLPFLESNETLFLKPMDQALRLWTRIDTDPPPHGFKPPLVLRDGTDRAAFAAGIAIIRSGYRARETAQAEERLARKRREALLPILRGRAMQYRNVVLGSFPKDHFMVKSLPRLWPEPKPKPASTIEQGPEVL